MLSSKIKDPQEVVALYMLPAIRSGLAKELKARGLDQRVIAKLLCVTEPAVSQYLNAKRATETALNDNVQAEIALSASRLRAGSSILQEAHHLLGVALAEGVTCAKCQEVLGSPQSCTLCFDGPANFSTAI